MNLSGIALGEVLGIKTPSGPIFYRRTAEGLDGPFADRACQFRAKPVAAEMMSDLNRKMGRQKVFGGRNRKMVMSDGVAYTSDASGTIRRDDKRLTTKEKRSARKAANCRKALASLAREIYGEESKAKEAVTA